MTLVNKDVIKLYNKIMEARKKIKICKNPNNFKIKIFIDKEFLGEYTGEELKSKGILC